MSAVMGGVGNLLSNNPTGDSTYTNKTKQSDALNDFSNNYDQQRATAGQNADTELTTGTLSKGLYGEGGLQSQLQSQGNDLASRGYSLQQPDYEAYGQASGDIARQFGQQDNDISQSLASRGLAGGSSGAAGAAFSGSAGNKNEMLAKAQTDIAQKRMQDTTQRLQFNQQMQSQLGAQGQNTKNQMVNDTLNQKGNALSGAANNELGVNTQGNMVQEEANKNAGKNIGDAVSQGLFSSGQQIGASPGTGASSFSSSMGSTLGSGGGGMMSDEDQKENIRDGSQGVQDFLDSLTTKKYDYKPHAKGLAGAGEGTHYSPMAQDLEKTPAGSSMVEDTPEGKMVDYGKGFGVLASGLGEINKRLKNVEGRA